MTRTICISSGKGGVGKSTITSNLAYALTELNQDVIAIDANLTTPHLGLQLGVHLTPRTLHDYLRGDTSLNSVIYPHPFGFKVIPASISVNDLVGADINKLQDVVLQLMGKTDIILLDSAPSLGKEATSSLQASDEVLLITNPDLQSVLDALKVSKVAESLNKKVLGVVINRVRKSKHELKKYEIIDIINYPVLAVIPEDKKVHKSIALRVPLLDLDPYSPAALEIKRLAHYLIGREFTYKSYGFFDRIIRFFQ
ncbi:MAG: cell division ATPase MinD [Candidatus Aenigmatarchaeota archaeon]